MRGPAQYLDSNMDSINGNYYYYGRYDYYHDYFYFKSDSMQTLKPYLPL